jgi:hypothetical protein
MNETLTKMGFISLLQFWTVWSSSWPKSLPVLPDGIFSNQKSKFGQFLLCIYMLVYFMDIWYTYFTAIWYIILAFGVFYCYSVYFSPFWYIVPKKHATVKQSWTVLTAHWRGIIITYYLCTYIYNSNININIIYMNRYQFLGF